MKLMLDTNVLARLCAPGEYPDAKAWFRQVLVAPSTPELLVSVLTDFEYRKALARSGATAALANYDQLLRSLRAVPVSAEVTRRASSLAGASAVDGPPQLSDADAILAVQAMLEGAVLVTSDRALRTVPDLDARDWMEIDPAACG